MDEGFITRTATVQDMFLNELPQGVTLLPEDWEGETVRVTAKFAISQQAIKNMKFDVEGFIRAKLHNTLTAIRQRRGIKELRLTHRFQCASPFRWTGDLRRNLPQFDTGASGRKTELSCACAAAAGAG